MTEWMGIKTGGLYKLTGKGSRSAPLLMVVKIEQHYFKPADIFPDGSLRESAWAHADVTMMVNGRLVVFNVRHHAAGTSACASWDESLRWARNPELRSGVARRDLWQRADGVKWPYVEVA